MLLLYLGAVLEDVHWSRSSTDIRKLAPERLWLQTTNLPLQMVLANVASLVSEKLQAVLHWLRVRTFEG